jgi:tRNA 5-methylaminomethyl-2-thiouridine biosynthesis bifunctional protein
VNGALLHWPTQPASDDTPRWQACGALRLFADATTNGVPPDAQALLRAGGVAGLQGLTGDQASEVAGLALASGGLWLPGAAWARPVQLIAAWLDHPAIQTHCLAQVVSLTRQSDQWLAVTATGQEVRADVVVLANGQHALPLLAVLGGSPNAMPLSTVRGQTTHLADPGLQPLRCILSGQGYVLPSVAGTTVIGSSYQPDRQDTAIDPADHESNLGQAQAMLPAWQPPLNNAALTGHAALRVIVPDRLPMIGALPNPDPWHSTPAPKVPGSLHLREWPRHPGLYIATAYGSRGLTWAWLGAEVIASLACGEPPPIEADLLDAIDPARFVLRETRRG